MTFEENEFYKNIVGDVYQAIYPDIVFITNASGLKSDFTINQDSPLVQGIKWVKLSAQKLAELL